MSEVPLYGGEEKCADVGYADSPSSSLLSLQLLEGP